MSKPSRATRKRQAIAPPPDTDSSALAVTHWWTLYMPGTDPAKLRDLPTIARAISEVGMVSLAHLMGRLMNPATLDRDKDKIALAMAPKLVQEFRGRIPGSGNAPGAEEGGGEHAGGTGGLLLEQYGARLTR